MTRSTLMYRASSLLFAATTLGALIAVHVAGAALFVGVALLGWGWLFDQSAGRRRCPSCSYAIMQTPQPGRQDGIRCPECGHRIGGVRALHRPRGSRWLKVAALPWLLAAVLLGLRPRAERDGWPSLLPADVLIIAARWGDAPWARDEIVERCRAMNRWSPDPVTRLAGRTAPSWRPGRRTHASLSDRHLVRIARGSVHDLGRFRDPIRRDAVAAMLAWSIQSIHAPQQRHALAPLLRTLSEDDLPVLRALSMVAGTDLSDARETASIVLRMLDDRASEVAQAARDLMILHTSKHGPASAWTDVTALLLAEFSDGRSRHPEAVASMLRAVPAESLMAACAAAPLQVCCPRAGGAPGPHASRAALRIALLCLPVDAAAMCMEDMMAGPGRAIALEALPTLDDARFETLAVHCLDHVLTALESDDHTGRWQARRAVERLLASPAGHAALRGRRDRIRAMAAARSSDAFIVTLPFDIDAPPPRSP